MGIALKRNMNCDLTKALIEETLEGALYECSVCGARWIEIMPAQNDTEAKEGKVK